jgi:hypothetical protein
LVVRRKSADNRRFGRGWHLEKIALGRGCDGIEDLLIVYCRVSTGDLPFLEAGANFFFQSGPGSGQ